LRWDPGVRPERDGYTVCQGPPAQAGDAMHPYEDQAIEQAVDNLVAEIGRVEPNLLQEDAREEIRRTVEDLMRDAGKVDEPG
jgi:predicted component of type VI protein secretion system